MTLNFDQKAAIAGVILYVAAVVAYVPRAGYPRMLGGGVLLFGGLVMLSRLLGQRTIPVGSVLAVSFGGAAVLVVPAFPAMGGTRLAEIPVGFLGSQAAALLWMTLRWRGGERGGRTSLRALAFGGLIAAGALCAIATIPMLVMIAAEGVPARTLWLLYAGYVAGTLGAMCTYWLLQPISHRIVGRYLIGLLGGACVYGAVAPVVFLMEGDPVDPAKLIGGALILGSLVGPPVALALIDSPAP